MGNTDDRDTLVDKLADTTNALRISRLHAESLEMEVADLRNKLKEVEQALLSETHLAESRLIKIHKLKKRFRRVDGPITEGSALDRVHEFISTVNERLQNIDAQYEDLCGAVDIIHTRIDALGSAAPARAIAALTTRLSGLESAYDYLWKDMLHG